MTTGSIPEGRGGRHLSAGVASSGQGTVYDAGRKELSQQLHRLNPIIADLYDRAITTLAESSGSVDRVMVVGHCIRELANNLAEALGDVDGIPTRSDTSKPMAELARVWALHMGSAADLLTIAAPPEADSQSAPPLVSVRAEVLIAAKAVVRASDMASGNAHKRHSAVVLGYVEARQDATVTIYHRAVDYFTNIAHLDKLNPEALPRTEDIISHLETIEIGIRARLSGFFDVANELKPLQAAANRKRVVSRES